MRKEGGRSKGSHYRQTNCTPVSRGRERGSGSWTSLADCQWNQQLTSSKRSCRELSLLMMTRNNTSLFPAQGLALVLLPVLVTISFCKRNKTFWAVHSLGIIVLLGSLVSCSRTSAEVMDNGPEIHSLLGPIVYMKAAFRTSPKPRMQ